MGERHWKDSRRYAKADVYGVPDLRREYRISFAVACLCRTLCELCDYRDLVYIGTITELHELTGLGRKTIKAYLDELCDKKLITELPGVVGAREALFDVSFAYEKLVVPNEETPRSRAKKAAKEEQLEPERVPIASSTRQMTRSAWENTTSGGREAVRREESEGVSSSYQSLEQEHWSHEPRQLFRQVAERWQNVRPHLERELRNLGLDPDGDWAGASASSGLDGKVAEAFMSVVEGFQEF